MAPLNSIEMLETIEISNIKVESMDTSETYEILQTEFKGETLNESRENREMPPSYFIDMFMDSDKASDQAKKRTFAQLGVSKEEILNKLFPTKRELSAEAKIRADEIKEREMLRYQQFMQERDVENPKELIYHPSKIRKHNKNQIDVSSGDVQHKLEKRLINNQKSLESRHKKKFQRTNNSYTLIYLRERILEYQLRMDMLKETIHQKNISK